MKTLASLTLIGLVSVTASGCFSYERRTPDRTVVVTETSPTMRETVVTRLPSGYRTRTYRGTTYYYTKDVVYRSAPRGGYVVVTRPW